MSPVASVSAPDVVPIACYYAAMAKRIETVDEGQAHLEALCELAGKRAEKNAEVTELKVVNC